MNRSTPGLPVHHQLLEFTQTHVHRVGDAIQPSHPLSPIPPSIRVFSSEPTLHMRWPKYWSFSFSIILGPWNCLDFPPLQPQWEPCSTRVSPNLKSEGCPGFPESGTKGDETVVSLYKLSLSVDYSGPRLHSQSMAGPQPSDALKLL